MKRKLVQLFWLCFISLLVLAGNSVPSRAQAGDPYSVIDAVNNLRAANGLPAYEVNSILMSIAQGHSDYQAAIGEVTHLGAGGSHPKDRAAAAGYGGGAYFSISENIAGGTDLSADGAIAMWLGDDLHIQTMLGTNYQYIGAGVSESNGFVYYTIDVASGTGSGSSSLPAQTTSGSTSGYTAGPTAIPIYLVQTATPKPDGSVVHTVLSGQTLISIAQAYGVKVSEIKELNYLTGDDIYVGNQLVIRRAGTAAPTSTETGTSTPTRAATATRRPTRTPTPSSTPEATHLPATSMPVQKEALQSSSDQLGGILVVAIIVLAAGGVVLMVAGSLIRRKS